MKTFSQPVTLKTARLILRQWKRADYAAYAALHADRVAMAFFTSTLDREESDVMADYQRELVRQRGWGIWALERRRDGAFIGSAGLHVPRAKLPFPPCVEIGWRLLPAYWGMGYATEAARESLRFAFEVLELPEVVAFTSVLNVRSIAVMLRLGMTTDPAQNFMHPDVPQGSPLREHCLYRTNCGMWMRDKGQENAGRV